jgi:hypothetical protein
VSNNLQAEFGTAPATEGVKAKCSTAAFPKMFTLQRESRFLSLQCHGPPQELLLTSFTTVYKRLAEGGRGLDWLAACEQRKLFLGQLAGGLIDWLAAGCL